MRYFVVTLIFSILLACNSKNENKTDKTGKFESNNDKAIDSVYNNSGNYTLKSDEVILTSGSNMDMAFGKNYKSWTPSEKDIEKAEKLLQAAFDDQKRGTVNRVLNKKTDDYNKQFIGGIDSSGDKIVWINCFCKSREGDFKNWKKDIIQVKDGGNCFLNVTVNITKRSYTSFMVNGNG